MNDLSRIRRFPTLLEMIEGKHRLRKLASNPNYLMHSNEYDDMVWLARHINEHLRSSQSPIINKEQLTDNILQIPHKETTVTPYTGCPQYDYYNPTVMKHGGRVNEFTEGRVTGVGDDNPNESEYYTRNSNGTWSPKPGVQYGENYDYAENIGGNWYWKDKNGNYIDERSEIAYPYFANQASVVPPVDITGHSCVNWLWDRADDERSMYNAQHGTNLRLNRQGNVTGDYAYFGYPLMGAMSLPIVSMAGTGALAGVLNGTGSGLTAASDWLGKTVMPWVAKNVAQPVFYGTLFNEGSRALTDTTPAEQFICRPLKTMGVSENWATAAQNVLDPAYWLFPWNKVTNGLFGIPSTPVTYNPVVKKPVRANNRDFTDFNTMVERMNANVEYSRTNPFKDGKMTGFRKWALDNGADPEKILEVEKKYSKNNWEALKRYSPISEDYSGGGKGYVQIYKDTPYFNQIFPHEVEHRLYAELFGEYGHPNTYSVNEINAAFKGKGNPMWTKESNEGDGCYFIDNDFEEITNRFTQIKNALGIKEPRALTAEELKQAKQMLEMGDKRLANNEMTVFLNNIKDWEAAAKLSGKALSVVGPAVFILNSNKK